MKIRKPQVGNLKYKCYKCRNLFEFKEVLECKKTFSNGSINTTYICSECKEKEDLISSS